MRKSNLPFKGTKEQESRLRAVLAELKGTQGPIMPALQKAQEIYGYLPIEVQSVIAGELNVPLEEIYGVVTFYSQFSLEKVGKYKIGVCLGTACYVKGSGDIQAKFEKELNLKPGCTTPDGLFTLEATRCIGCCGLAPVFTVNEDVYGKATEKDVDMILHMYRTKELKQQQN